MVTKDFTFTLTIKAIENTSNSNFGVDVYAQEILHEVFRDAQFSCLKAITTAIKNGNDALEKHLEAKLKAYEAIENTIKSFPKNDYLLNKD